MQLKFRVPEILLGALLAVAIFGIGFVTSSSLHPEVGERQPQANHSAEKITPKVATEERIADYTLALTVFTGVLALFTVFLWLATRRSAKIAERALTELEAPFIYVKIDDTGLRYNKSDELLSGKLNFNLGNYGRTPAHILEIWFDVIGVSHPVSAGPKHRDPDVIPGAAMPYGVVAGPSSQTQDFGMEFSRSIHAQETYFVGFVRYKDIFKRFYTLGFCFAFEPKSLRWILIGGTEHNYCRQDSGPPQTLPSEFAPSAKTGNLTAAYLRATIQAFGKKRT